MGLNNFVFENQPMFYTSKNYNDMLAVCSVLWMAEKFYELEDIILRCQGYMEKITCQQPRSM